MKLSDVSLIFPYKQYIDAAKALIDKYDIEATCSLKNCREDKEVITLTFYTPEKDHFVLISHRGENVILLNKIIELNDNRHTIRDIFFLIHNIVNENIKKRGAIVLDATYINNKAIIGCDGVGLFNLSGYRISIKHMGGVRIGRGVEIGPNTCVPRGVLDDTVIEDFVRIGYNCNIGHGSIIGTGTTIIDGATLGGSVTIGSNCWIGMNCTIREGVNIVDNVLVGMGSVVTKDLQKSGKYYGVPARRGDDWNGTW